MKKIVAFLLCILMIGSCVMTVSAAKKFTDVPAKAYFAKAVTWAVNKGVTEGMTKTTFAPNGTCTRAQAVTFIWRANGSPEPKGTNNPFTDVKKKDYFYKAVLWAVEKGITSGMTKTTFGPYLNCTRAQIVTFLWNSEGKVKMNAKNPFIDVKKNYYFHDAVLWAVENGITAGMNSYSFAPSDDCTRAQIVTFLMRHIEGERAQVSTDSTPDFALLMSKANELVVEMRFGGKYIDDTDRIEIEKTNEGRTYTWSGSRIKYPGINSLADFKAELSKYYADAVVEEILTYEEWEEKDGKLYRIDGGIGGIMPNKGRLVINKVNSKHYEIKVDWCIDDVVFISDDIYNYVYKNGSWSFDKKIEQPGVTDFEVICKNAADIPWDFALYSPIIESLTLGVCLGLSEDYEYSVSYLYQMNYENLDWDENLERFGYTLMDVDSNGTRELILGYCDSDNGDILDIFTIVDGKVVHLATSGERYMKTILSNGDMAEYWSNGAANSGYTLYKLNAAKNAYEPYTTVAYDGYEAIDKGLISDLTDLNDGNFDPYFKWQVPNYNTSVLITEKEVDAIVDGFYANPLKFKLIPFSEYDPAGRAFVRG